MSFNLFALFKKRSQKHSQHTKNPSIDDEHPVYPDLEHLKSHISSCLHDNWRMSESHFIKLMHYVAKIANTGCEHLRKQAYELLDECMKTMSHSRLYAVMALSSYDRGVYFFSNFLDSGADDVNTINPRYKSGLQALYQQLSDAAKEDRVKGIEVYLDKANGRTAQFYFEFMRCYLSLKSRDFDSDLLRMAWEEGLQFDGAPQAYSVGNISR